MAVIRDRDIPRGREAFATWREHRTSEVCATGVDETGRMSSGTRTAGTHDARRTPSRQDVAMAVRYTLHLLEERAPGGAVEVRVPPWGAVKILAGPQSDPHNLTPPDVIELDPETWLRLAAGLSVWDDERVSGRITAVGERDDLGGLLPLV
nr:sterol carrier family protein [uncultured Bifidobacterium sp.]